MRRLPTRVAPFRGAGLQWCGMTASTVMNRPPTIGTAVTKTAARLDAAVRIVWLIGCWSALLLVSYWWAAGGGFQDMAGWESGLTSTARLTGLVASVLLLIQVLLMSRLPLLERAYGQDRLAQIHRL